MQQNENAIRNQYGEDIKPDSIEKNSHHLETRN